MAKREKIWVVRAQDGSSILAILGRANEPIGAVAEGRVFLGKTRVKDANQPVKPGDTVRIGAPRPRGVVGEDSLVTGVSDHHGSIEILFERDGLIACVKPAGLPTVPDHAGSAHSLVARVAEQLATKASLLRVTSRLDRDVSGVVLFATSQEAEDRLKKARAEGGYRRRYVALARSSVRAPPAQAGIWTAPIGRSPRSKRLQAAGGADAKSAETRFRSIATSTAELEPDHHAVLFAVDPITGRTHQIRVHASHAGLPLIGDRDYGGPTRIALASGRILAPTRIALHAARVHVAGVTAEAEVPAEMADLWRALGGADEAWNTAVTCSTLE